MKQWLGYRRLRIELRQAARTSRILPKSQPATWFDERTLVVAAIVVVVLADIVNVVLRSRR
jgi:hypothetical protein